MQGCAVVTGRGMELVITLGTGVGSAVFFDGTLLPHMELSHGRFAEGLSIEVALGDDNRARRSATGVGQARRAGPRGLRALPGSLDHIYIGGGNAKRLDIEQLPTHARIVDNTAGIVGGVRLWDLDA